MESNPRISMNDSRVLAAVRNNTSPNRAAEKNSVLKYTKQNTATIDSKYLV